MGKSSLTKREEVRRIRTGRRKQLLKNATQKTFVKPEGWGGSAAETESVEAEKEEAAEVQEAENQKEESQEEVNKEEENKGDKE